MDTYHEPLSLAEELSREVQIEKLFAELIAAVKSEDGAAFRESWEILMSMNKDTVLGMAKEGSAKCRVKNGAYVLKCAETKDFTAAVVHFFVWHKVRGNRDMLTRPYGNAVFAFCLMNAPVVNTVV